MLHFLISSEINGIGITYALPENFELIGTKPKIKKPLGVNSDGFFNVFKKKSDALMSLCSPIVTNGGGKVTTGEHLQYHDFINVLLLSHERIIKQCPSLYKKGMSLREIAVITNIPKATILKTFQKNKV